MTARSRSGGQSTTSQVGRLVIAGLALLLLSLVGVCCSLPEHGGETAAVQVASAALANAEGRIAASAEGCPESESHAAVDGALRSSAPSGTADKRDLAGALYERRTTPSVSRVRSTEQVKQPAAASSDHDRSQVVLQV
ncbi:hypothetical protein M8Z33_30865 [Streptomyces sp. ZAF1911]|uniref:hypothetical protein n=1 Tax=Streptomyces sp. ZAF1911 TaxID=2944129 RepID=UPI00237B1DBE|nr:hypothetical protein [Streptomyces sp. ZAF1911]MDD9380976.1 hypothetical protein [Streptomyces sp. ZAF1911]